MTAHLKPVTLQPGQVAMAIGEQIKNLRKERGWSQADLALKVKGATSHGQAVYTNGKNFISPDVDPHSRGVWKMASSVDGFGPNQRLGTYDFLLQRFAK